MTKVLDVWSGDTVWHRGQRYFEVNNVLIPADVAVSRRLSWRERMGRMWSPPLSMAAQLQRFDQRRTVADRLRDAAQPFRPSRAMLAYQGVRMGNQGWQEVLDTTVADGTQISNSTSETIACPDFNIPAYYMAVGRTLRIWAFGVNSNVVTTPGTLTARVRWGGVGGTALLQSAAQSMDTAAHTNALWYLLAYITCRATGSSGSFLSGGIFAQFNLLASTAANLLPALLGSAGAPGASGNVVTTVDTTSAKLLSLTDQFSVSTSPTNLTCQQRIIEALN